MVVFSLIGSILGISSEGAPYTIFSFAALVPFTFFTTAVRSSSASILGNASILKKMAVPREIFPAAEVITAMIDFAISGVILLAMMVFYQIGITIHILWLPVLVLITAILAWGVGIGFAALGTYRRDFIMGVGFGLQMLTYATPIIYPLSDVPEEWRSLYVLNPLVGLIENYRNILIKGSPPDLNLLLISIVITILVCAIAWPLFRLMSQYFADVL
jgi:lipopolysaccharide transport system permease protein